MWDSFKGRLTKGPLEEGKHRMIASDGDLPKGLSGLRFFLVVFSKVQPKEGHLKGLFERVT